MYDRLKQLCLQYETSKHLPNIFMYQFLSMKKIIIIIIIKLFALCGLKERTKQKKQKTGRARVFSVLFGFTFIAHHVPPLPLAPVFSFSRRSAYQRLGSSCPVPSSVSGIQVLAQLRHPRAYRSPSGANYIQP